MNFTGADAVTKAAFEAPLQRKVICPGPVFGVAEFQQLIRLQGYWANIDALTTVDAAAAERCEAFNRWLYKLGHHGNAVHWTGRNA